MPELIRIHHVSLHPEIDRLLRKPNIRCPRCKTSPVAPILFSENCVFSPRYVMACDGCNYFGPYGKNVFDAIKKWSKGESLGLRGWIESCFKRRKRIVSKSFYA